MITPLAAPLSGGAGKQRAASRAGLQPVKIENCNNP